MEYDNFLEGKYKKGGISSDIKHDTPPFLIYSDIKNDPRLNAVKMYRSIGMEAKARNLEEKVKIDARKRYERAREIEAGYNTNWSGVPAVLGFIFGIFFLSPNITGNVIGNLNQTSSNFIGVGLLFIGILAGFFWFNKSRKKNVKNSGKKKLRKKK